MTSTVPSNQMQPSGEVPPEPVKRGRQRASDAQKVQIQMRSVQGEEEGLTRGQSTDGVPEQPQPTQSTRGRPSAQSKRAA